MQSVLFVCLGNICRSPLAEAAFRRAVADVRLDIQVNSAGTGNWHVGDPPDPRAQAVALKNGVDISGYQGRQVHPADFQTFTHIIALDQTNLADLTRLRPSDAGASLSLLLDHVNGREGQGVADPYYGDDAGFDVTWDEVVAGAAGLIRALRAHPSG